MKNISEEIASQVYKLILNNCAEWDQKLIDELSLKIINNTRVLISNPIYNAISPIPFDVTIEKVARKIAIT